MEKDKLDFKLVILGGEVARLEYEFLPISSDGKHEPTLARLLIKEFGLPDNWRHRSSGTITLDIKYTPVLTNDIYLDLIFNVQCYITNLLDKAIFQRRIAKAIQDSQQ